MISLILLVFIVQLAIYLINTIGANTIDDLLWLLYLRLPFPISKDAQKHTELKRDVVQLKREMNATSSQDEFAKWAKLRRRHDKVMDEYEAMNRSLSSRKTSFQFSVKTVRWLSTNGLRFFLQFYYSKTPVYDLPPGWFPYPVEWILSFPRAPLGTVSIQVWGGACAAAITLTGELVVLVLQQTSGGGQQVNGRKQAQSVPAGEKSEVKTK